MRKNNNEHKKIKQTYVISLCIIACHRIWSEIKKRRKKTNMTSEWLSLQFGYIIFDWSSIASVSNSKWIIWIALYTIHSCYYLCSLFYSKRVWQHDVTRHIYNVFFLEFLFLSYCTLHSLNTGYKIKCDVNWVIIEFSTNPSIRQSTINERKMFLDSRPRGELTKNCLWVIGKYLYLYWAVLAQKKRIEPCFSSHIVK